MPIFIKTELIKKEYLVQKDIRKKIINDHHKWIKDLKRKGINIKSGFLVNGLKQPGAGGLLIIEIETYKDALEIIKNDPMIKNNIVEWQLNEWIDIDQ
uniref:YCII-related domain-containing protein n=1 Tax=uncultured Prochlorococcus marinus clone HOT0M-5C8 TaxID=379389 RepID=Q1PJD5_PROMR|nr:conserved hypothetical protein [uncultured Prochlorococcus marinus clone HOT0M-5C8]